MTITPRCATAVTVTSSMVVVALSGELDMSDAADVRAVLLEAAGAGRPLVRVRVDDLTFTDSSGLGVLLAGMHAAERAHCAFEVVNPQPRIMRLFEVAGVIDTLSVRTESPNAE